MMDQDKSKQQLLEELAELRQRVTVLESAESERQRSEERYRLFTEAIPQMLWRADANRQTIECNHRWYDYTGQTPEEARGSGWMKTLHPDDVARVTERVRAAQANGTAYEAEYRIRRASDYSYRWHLSRALPMKDEDGKITGWFGSVTDVDDQKRAEEELAKEKAILQAAVECLPFDFFAIGADGHYVLANAVCRVHWGRLVGKTPEEMAPNEHVRGLWLANNRRAFAGEKVAGEASVTVGGEERFIYNVIAPIRDERQFYGILGVNVDITDRKRAEEALQKAHDELEDRVKARTAELREANDQLQREVEERQRMEVTLNAFFDASPAILNIVDEDFRYLKTDRLTPTYFGLNSQSIIGKSAKELAPKWVEEYGAMVQRVVATGEPLHNIEVKSPVPSRPGETACWRASYFAIPLPDGKRGNGVVAVEITDMKRGEAALRESEERYRTLVETSPDTVVLADLHGNVTFASHEILKLHGSENVEYFVGKHPLDFIAEEDHPRFLANFQQTLEEGVTRNIEYTFLKKDGSCFPGEVSGTVIRDAVGTPTAVMAIIRDITERKRAEQALQQAHDHLRAIYDGIIEGLVITDVETKRFLRVNSPLCRMLGYSEEELLAASINDIHPPEEIPNELQRFQAIAEGRMSLSEARPVLRKDGSILYADIAGHPIFYNGRSCTLALFRDITERKQAEEALKKEHRTLKHLLQSSDHERQTIAYEIHDELAQQLAGAIMMFQAYDHLKGTKPKASAQVFEAGMTMLHHGHSEARHLIAGVRPPILDESGVVEAVAHLVHEQERGGGAKIRFDSEVDFDRLTPTLENTIYRITQEALTNACQHSKSEKVRVSLLQVKDRVRIEVRDWGVGFDPKTTRGDHFGLEGIRQRARLLGGKCSIKSKLGKGTVVAVELPVVVRDEEG